ncbi:nucleotide-binding domain containing protein [Nonomuraea polychroma]|uniref:nucleotide-binding domain containing protein n=1 Tax=Nonomuraea polychroma TaxID=46176 RepID=UPI000FDEF05F|nr:nucleotide-binding domain containing protein [Nonomuraea polychroma]
MRAPEAVVPAPQPSPAVAGGHAGPARGTLIVCGSHTAAASAQLAALADALAAPIRTISTAAALRDPRAEARRVAEIARRDLAERGVALVASERKRLADHGTLAHGAQIMTAICATVTALRPCLAAVIAKGGITSAQVARDGLGAASAWVVGPLLPGVAVWEIEASAGTTISYAVVPGNVGDTRTLVDVAHAFGLLT